jgi:hypothetical protein
MFKTLAAAVATVALALGLSLVAVAPASAEGASNDPSFYVTPNTSEVCAKWTPSGDTTTVTAASFSIPAGATLTKVIIKAGNTGAGGEGPENHGYYTDATYQYPAAYADLDWVHVSDLSSTTFSHPSGKNLSHAIYCYIPAPAPTDVAGAAAATNPVCTDGNIVSGFITVTITTGVTYVITNSSNTVIPFDGTGKTGNLPGGSYTVAVSASSSAYNLTSASSIPLTIGADPEGCGAVLPTDVAGAASATNPVCTDGHIVSGFITVTITTGVTYVITDSSNTVIPFDGTTGKTGNLPAGSYTVAVSASSSAYNLTSAASIPLTIAADPTGCGSVGGEVTPAAVPTGESCSTDFESAQKVPGFITVSNVGTITYTITRDSDSSTYAYDANGKSVGLPSGAYTVHPVAKPGSTLSSTADIHVTVTAFDGKCQLPSDALATPNAVKDPGCSAHGSYTLSNSLNDPAAIIWTVNGLPATDGPHTVNGPATLTVHAAANGPAFGLNDNVQTDWTLTFADPATCGDLKTLALTGTTDGTPLLAASAMLMLLGVALVRSGLRIRRRNTAS